MEEQLNTNQTTGEIEKEEKVKEERWTKRTNQEERLRESNGENMWRSLGIIIIGSQAAHLPEIETQKKAVENR